MLSLSNGSESRFHHRYFRKLTTGLRARLVGLAINRLTELLSYRAQGQEATLKLADLVAARLAALPGNPAHDAFYKHGFHLLRKHYYLPVPDESDSLESFWDQQSAMPGVDMNDDHALGLLRSVFPRHMPEFRRHYPIDQLGAFGQFYLINGTYMAVDAHVYFSFIREYKPKRIVEIGAGYSTFLSCSANEINRNEGGRGAHITAIDPYPHDAIKSGQTGVAELIEKRVQDVGLDLFTSLESGDILFIDSSHVLRSGNDVQYEYMEILPRLKPGVFVHIHDISLPRAYPKVYYENHLYWNEQYLLQAFLAFNGRFDVIWPGNYMMIKYPEEMLAVFPEFRIMRQSYPQSEPTAFWIRSK